ncbi:uncharacterized protein EAF01_002548 [Botrytis porri]|uniref:uncharacterized protein n=1 Tax=Botrytis porri TaxID=87229 RepID=UPI0018FF5DCE|nr:uncharacterized protein EAF01_002548 [Botrytis porri]KAF7911040.1 hypothetical protein EAF01_002548 [Botrytis porri]
MYEHSHPHTTTTTIVASYHLCTAREIKNRAKFSIALPPGTLDKTDDQKRERECFHAMDRIMDAHHLAMSYAICRNGKRNVEEMLVLYAYFTLR